MSHPNLSNAPIHEALIDFRVRPRPDLDADALSRRMSEVLADQFPDRQSIRSVSLEVPAEATGGPVMPVRAIEGVQLRTEDARKVVRARRDGLSFHMLAPYTEWSELVGYAMELWEYYQQEARPRSLVRIATRFINRLDSIHDPLRDTLRTPPTVEFGGNYDLSGFVIQKLLRAPDGYESRLSVASKEPPVNGFRVITVDVESYRAYEAGDEPECPVSRPQLEAPLSRLHELKNDLFFHTLTDEAISRYA